MPDDGHERAYARLLVPEAVVLRRTVSFAAHVTRTRRCGQRLALGTTLAVCLTIPAEAQVVPTSADVVPAPWNAIRVFERSPLPKLEDPDIAALPEPEDLPVKTRRHPGYEPIGVRSGSWMFNPSLTAGTFFDSNVFSSNTQKKSDIAGVIEPALRARTLWDRHGLDLKIGAQSSFYRDNSSLDQNNYGIRGNGWVDVTRDLAILTNFQASRLNEGVGSLSSPANAISPTPYDLLSGDVTVRKQFNRLSVAVGGGVDSYNFGSARAQDGSIIRQDARDGQIYAIHGRTDYALSPNLGWFASVELNQRNLRGTTTQSLDSQGYRVLSGANIALTNIVTGEFGAGYVRQRFDDPSIGTIEGPAYRALLTWRPTRTIDVNLKAEQIVTQTSETSATGVMASAVQLGIDYEFRRNVILSAIGSYENDKFFGQFRKDNVTAFESRVTYLPNRFGTISLFHKYIQRDSNVPVFTYDKHQVGINVTAQF